jgi:uncharacterized damage-inducible protein DinB
MPDQQSSTLATFYEGWHHYQDLLTAALAPLSPAQLSLRAAPNLRSLHGLVTHIIGARARWFNFALGEGDQGFVALATWDRPGEPERTAAELVAGLETTWRVMHEAIARWMPADWTQTYQNDPGDEPAIFTRQWVVWHLVEHDLHHGGEVSLTLGMHSLTAPDL